MPSLSSAIEYHPTPQLIVLIFAIFFIFYLTARILCLLFGCTIKAMYKAVHFLYFGNEQTCKPLTDQIETSGELSLCTAENGEQLGIKLRKSINGLPVPIAVNVMDCERDSGNEDGSATSSAVNTEVFDRNNHFNAYS